MIVFAGTHYCVTVTSLSHLGEIVKRYKTSAKINISHIIIIEAILGYLHVIFEQFGASKQIYHLILNKVLMLSDKGASCLHLLTRERQIFSM